MVQVNKSELKSIEKITGWDHDQAKMELDPGR
jgi:hypothetical protein